MHSVLKATFGAALAIVAFTGAASAAPFDVSYDPNPNLTVNTSTPRSFSLSIPGFSAVTDTVTDALLQIVLSDDGMSEGIRYNFEGNIYNQNNTGNAAQTYSFDFGDLNILSTLADGNLNITLSATSGSYIFNSARLTGEYTQSSPAGVPEPMTLGLLGAGLLGMGLAARRRRVS